MCPWVIRYIRGRFSVIIVGVGGWGLGDGGWAGLGVRGERGEDQRRVLRTD